MRRRYIYFLLTYFHNSSKKEHIKKYSIKSTINSIEAGNLPGPSSAPSARHVLVRPAGALYPTNPTHGGKNEELEYQSPLYEGASRWLYTCI